MRRFPHFYAGLVASLGCLVVVSGCAPSAPVTASSSASALPLRQLAQPRGLAIGTAVNTSLLADATYSGIVADQFSTVTPENAMKWSEIEPTQGVYNWGPADQLVDFAQQHGQKVRGHTLVWHQQVPAWVGTAAATMTDAEFTALVKKHVQDEVTHFKGRIWQWDVVNEALDEGGAPRETIFRQHLGDDYIAQVFQWAHEADPDALLFYNDYGIESSNSKLRKVVTMVSDLKARGVPIDGVGFQAHFDENYGVPDMAAALKMVTDLGLKVVVTEMDVRGAPGADGSISNPDRVGKLYQASLAACLGAGGACLSFTYWGVSDKDSWVPQAFPGQLAACLYDPTYQPNPWYSQVAAVLAGG